MKSESIIDFLLDLAMENSFNPELRAKPDGLGYFTVNVNFINPKFTELIKKNKLSIINVSPNKTHHSLFVTLQFNVSGISG